MTLLLVRDARRDRAARGEDMLYRKNLGSGEGWLRGVVGAGAAAAALMQVGMTPLGLGLAASGAFLALTGVFGFCPACAMVGRKPPGPPR
jgi:hypothetical protein